MKKLFAVIAILFMLLLVGCDKSENVNNNLRRQEGNFSIYRRVVVINLRTDKVLFEVKGYLAIDIDEDGDLNVTIKTGADEYKLHYISLPDGAIYLSEQIESTHTNPYHFEITIFVQRPDFKFE